MHRVGLILFIGHVDTRSTRGAPRSEGHFVWDGVVVEMSNLSVLRGATRLGQAARQDASCYVSHDATIVDTREKSSLAEKRGKEVRERKAQRYL